MTEIKRNPVVRLKTGQGSIKIELYADRSPITTANILDLLTREFYNGLLFHRFVEGHVIQAGDRQGDGKGGFIDPKTGTERTIPLEVCSELKHDRSGIGSMDVVEKLHAGDVIVDAAVLN